MKYTIITIGTLVAIWLFLQIFESEFMLSVGGGFSQKNIKGISAFMSCPILGLGIGIVTSYSSRSAAPIIATILGSLITLSFFNYTVAATTNEPGYMFPSLHLLALPISAAGYIIPFLIVGILAFFKYKGAN